MLPQYPLWLLLPIIWLIYSLLKYTHRLLFHPLAKFPGPPLAKLTRLYAASIDCAKQGDVVHLLPEWHRKYGPIIHITPNELHIHDWNAYNQVFKAGTKFNKDITLYNNPSVDHGMFNMPASVDAKRHKDLYQNAFSRASVNKLEPLLHEKLDIFLEKLKVSEGVVELDTGFNALTGDTVMHWVYQESFGLLDAPGFQAPILKYFEELTVMNPPLWYWPEVLIPLIRSIGSLPQHWKPAGLRAVDKLVETCRSRILRMQRSDAEDVRDSIFATALHPMKSDQVRLGTAALTGDAVLMFLAGTGTTAEALTVGTWHILNDLEMQKRLLLELDTAMPDAKVIYKQNELEQLPYLRGIIKESIRMSLGSSARLMRIVPPEGAVFCGRRIPGGTRVSFANYVYNLDPEIFEDPHAFKPERWIASSDSKDQERVRELEARMISFSRGSRSCIGINLAYAELYNTFAHVFRRFEMAIEGTTAWDMEWKDCFVPQRNGHLNVRMRQRP